MRQLIQSVSLAQTGSASYRNKSNRSSRTRLRVSLALILICSGVTAASLTLVTAGSGRARRATLTAYPQTSSSLPGLTADRASSAKTLAPFAASISASLTDNIPAGTKVAPGGTVNYTATITNSGVNSPADDATNLNFSAALDANTTLTAGSIHASPIAFNETYNWVGNTFLDTTARSLPTVIANDVAANAPGGTDTFSVNTITSGASTLGGTINLAADGSFTYAPPVSRPNTADGASVNDTFTYTIKNDADTSLTASGTVTIALTGRVWYVQNAASNGTGLSNNPFNSPASASTAANKSTDIIYIFTNTGNPAMNGGFSLGNGVELRGQGLNLIVNSITLFNAAAFPSFGNTGGNGVTLAVGASNTLDGFVITACSGSAIASGASFGTLTVNNVSVNNTTGPALTLTSGALNANFTSLSSSNSGTNAISLTTCTGTLTNNAGTLSNSTGALINISGGSASMTHSGGVSQGSNAAALSVTGGHTGTLTFQTGAFSATNGTGLQFDNADGSYNFNGATTLNGGDAGIDIQNGSGGTFSFPNAAITNPSGIAYREDSSTANVTFGGTVTKNNNANSAVKINAKTGGTTAFNNAGGGQITASTTTANAIDLTNTGGTVNFTGGLNLSTTSGIGFNATGSGATVNVTQDNTTVINTISSTTGAALNVTNTTIGSSNLTFRSISANGAPSGIVLNNTGSSGGLVVTGDTGSANNSSGGTIQNTTSHGISLTSTRNVSLDQMNVQNTTGSGINGTGVTNFTLQNSTFNTNGTVGGADTSNVAFNVNAAGTENNLSGTVTITSNTLNNAAWHGIDILNFNGTINNANLSNNSFTSPTTTATSKGSAIRLEPLGSAATVANITTATINNNTIANFPSGSGILVQGGNSNASGPAGVLGTPSTANQITISGNHIAGQSAANKLGVSAILATVSGKGVARFDINNNGTIAQPITNVVGVVIGCGTNGNTTSEFFVTNNVVVANNTVASGGISGGNGITFSNADTPNMTWTIKSNNISNTDGNGIIAVSRGVTGTLKVNISSNTVGAPLTGVRPGIRVDAGNNTSVDDSVCATISGNTSGGSGGSPGIGIRKQGTVAGTNDFGLVGLSPGTATYNQAEDYVASLNPGSVLGTAADGGSKRCIALNGDNFVSCNTAPPIAPPNDDGIVARGADAIGNENNANRPELAQQSASTGGGSASPATSRWLKWALHPLASFAPTVNFLHIGNSLSASLRVSNGSKPQSDPMFLALAYEHAQEFPGSEIFSEPGPNVALLLTGGYVDQDLYRHWVPAGQRANHVASDQVSRIYRSDARLSNRAARSYAESSSQDRNAPTSGETVSLNSITTFPAGKTITIKYAATVNTTALTARQASTQGTVTANGGISVLTDDPEPAGGPQATVTLLDTTLTWTGATDANWNTASNWNRPGPAVSSYAPGVSNPAVNDVAIPNVGAQPNISVSDIGIFSLNISNGRTLTITSPRVLTIGGSPGGDLTLDGIISGGNLNLGTGTHVINNAGGTGSLSSTNVATVLSGSTVTLNNNLQAGLLAINAGGSMNITNRTLSLNGSGAALTVPGGATFTTTGSTVIFNGTAAQQAAGIAYNNLTINNSIGTNVTGVTLTGNASVGGTLALTSSDLDTGAFTLTQPNTTAATGVSDVVGTVSRTGGPFALATPLTFGNPNNILTITAGATRPSTVTFAIAKAAPANPNGYAAAVQRTYTISQTGGVGFTSTLRLHYLDSELNGNTPEASLNLRRLRTSDNHWTVHLPITVDSTNNWVESTGVLESELSTRWTMSTLAPTASDGVITGRIVDSNGRPVEGAVVRLNGAQNRKFITDRNGNYRFENVVTGGFYTVTPSRANYHFNPFNRSFSQTGNQTEAAFTAESMGDNANPLDTPEYFVRQQYVDVLNREPEEAGFNYWSDTILGCGEDTQCVNTQRREVAAAFFISAENQATGSYIYDAYSGALGRRPAFGEFSTDRQQVVSGETLDTAKTAFAQHFVQRTEFVSKYQNAATADAFVEALIQSVQSSGVDLSGERANLISTYDQGADLVTSRAAVLRAVADNATFKQSQYNQDFVLTEYFAYLQRDAEPDGFNFWVNVLNTGDPGNYRGMVCSFVTSAEYQNRFSRIVSHSNGECSGQVNR